MRLQRTGHLPFNDALNKQKKPVIVHSCAVQFFLNLLYFLNIFLGLVNLRYQALQLNIEKFQSNHRGSRDRI